MSIEIERKYLVKGDFKTDVKTEIGITQGYISSDPDRSVRIRIKGNKGYITIKGKSSASGASRFEWEEEISVDDAKDLLELCEPGIIKKIRYIVPEASGLEFEIDVFEGDNEGLILAEIELPAEDHPFEKPLWLGKEVTGDKRYYNSQLKNNPYKNWK